MTLLRKSDSAVVVDMTSGSIVGILLRVAAPLFLSNLLQTVYNLVDMVIVGHYVGEAGLSAVAISGDIMHFMTFLSMGLASAGQVMLARFVGERRMHRIGPVISNLLFLLLISAGVIMAILILFGRALLRWLHTPGEAETYALQYLWICTIGVIPVFGYNGMSAALRGVGDFRHPVLFVSIGAAVNLLLDLLLVAVFELSVAGAALATSVSQCVSFLCITCFFQRHQEELYFAFPKSRKSLRLDVCKRILKLGLPMALQLAAIQLSILLVNSWINVGGVTVSALNGISSKLNSTVNLLSGAVSTAAGSMVSQCFGARKNSRVPRIIAAALALSLSVAVCASILLFLFPDAVFGLFTSAQDVLESARGYVPVAVVLFVGGSLRGPMNALINSSQNYRLNVCTAVLDSLVGRIGLAYLLGFQFGMGVFGFWYGHALAGYMPFFVGAAYLLSGAWKPED